MQKKNPFSFGDRGPNYEAYDAPHTSLVESVAVNMAGESPIPPPSPQCLQHLDLGTFWRTK